MRRRAALLLLFAGCSCAPAFVAQRPYAPPSEEQLLEVLRRRHQALRTVDLETKTTSWLGGERLKADVTMLVERQGRLRFSAEVALRGEIAALVTDGATFSLLDMEANVYRHGPACPKNVASLIPVPLAPPEIAAMLLGDAPLGTDVRTRGVTWDGHARADVLALEGGRPLWVSFRPRAGGAWDVVGVQGEGPGGRWRVEFAEHALDAATGETHPTLIRFAEPNKSFDDGVEIKVKERRLNAQLRPQAFVLTPPEGYPVEHVPCPPGDARP